MAWRVGVDSGGTFTDVCLYEEGTGRIEVWKTSSTPADPSDGILRGIREGIEAVGARLEDISYLGHGTTVSTNALIQHRGVPTGLITTDGFRDLLEIGRQKRPDLYDPQADKPVTLVERANRIGVPERVSHAGEVEIPLDEEAMRAAARALRQAGVEAVAICFLYSFARTAHEEIAERILLEEFPEAYTSVSHRVAPEFREFERLSTTVVNSYLGPVMGKYIRRLVSKLSEIGVAAAPHLTQSNGGVISPETAASLPARTILSGPSTGVVAAQAIASATGIGDLITFDMGGTSSDVALLSNGVCRLVSEADVHGYPLKAPMLDINTAGAGGGSIAYVDVGGLLKVGPRSAGAYPGPACYGNGNTQPTVTDANVLLQTLNPEYLLNGKLKIDRDLSQAAIESVAAQLGLTAMETAEGILDIVTANMAKAIRVVSTQRGFDPRDYTLVAFGGAGPLHAARLAGALGMKRVLVPPTPGIMCALGLLITDMRTDFAVTRLRILQDMDIAELGQIYAELEQRAEAWFESENVPEERRLLRRTVDVRYLGQNYEIAVPVPAGPIGADTVAAIAAGFAAGHHQAYGFVAEGDPVQTVIFRLEAVGVVDKASFSRHEPGGPDASGAIVGSRRVWDAASAGFVENPLYDRRKLAPGNTIQGPAIVEQMDSTTVIPSGVVARVDEILNLLLELEPS